MNVQSAIRYPSPVKLTAAGFRMLQQAGAFAGYTKSELIEGELSGVPHQPDDAVESDVSIPIKLRLEQYASLAAFGFLRDCGKTELIDGIIYALSPQYRPHGFVKDELTYRLRVALEALGSSLHVATEQSVAIAPHSQPQPDIVLTREPRGSGAIPIESVPLVVEISASTVGFDLSEKVTIYASAGVAEYWVVDVNARVVHQMWQPRGAGYAERMETPFGNAVDAKTGERLSVATDNL